MFDPVSFSRQLPEGPLAVAVSGGVDSLCALLLCLQTQRPVLAVHARLSVPDDPERLRLEDQTILALASLCTRLGADFHLLDLQKRFHDEVVAPFAKAYLQGLTPNPCAFCNRAIKFGAILEGTLGLGAQVLITGHYAHLDRTHPYAGSAPLLGRARDTAKDQSYFLGLVPRKVLSRVAFPLEDLTKEEVRALVGEAGLSVPAPGESQEICFVPPTPQGYRDFLAGFADNAGALAAGDMVELDSGQIVGRHQGLWQYTEGQRRGLGIAWKEPLYVLAKDRETNVLTVGSRQHTQVSWACIEDINWMIEKDELPKRCTVRLRYRQAPIEAEVRLADEGLEVFCKKATSLSAPGQVAAISDDRGRILAAGILKKLA